MSPYEVVFGRTPRLPLELELGLPLANPMTQAEYAHTVHNVFKDIRTIARQHLATVDSLSNMMVGTVSGKRLSLVRQFG
jgi:hypothetical protein